MVKVFLESGCAELGCLFLQVTFGGYCQPVFPVQLFQCFPDPVYDFNFMSGKIPYYSVYFPVYGCIEFLLSLFHPPAHGLKAMKRIALRLS